MDLEIPDPSIHTASRCQNLCILLTGAIAFVSAPIDGYQFDFTVIEVYGAAHLAFLGNRTNVSTVYAYGDDTGYVYIAPYQAIELTEVSMQMFISPLRQHIQV